MSLMVLPQPALMTSYTLLRLWPHVGFWVRMSQYVQAAKGIYRKSSFLCLTCGQMEEIKTIKQFKGQNRNSTIKFCWGKSPVTLTMIAFVNSRQTPGQSKFRVFIERKEGIRDLSVKTICFFSTFICRSEQHWEERSWSVITHCATGTPEDLVVGR